MTPSPEGEPANPESEKHPLNISLHVLLTHCSKDMGS